MEKFIKHKDLQILKRGEKIMKQILLIILVLASALVLNETANAQNKPVTKKVVKKTSPVLDKSSTKLDKASTKQTGLTAQIDGVVLTNNENMTGKKTAKVPCKTKVTKPKTTKNKGSEKQKIGKNQVSKALCNNETIEGILTNNENVTISKTKSTRKTKSKKVLKKGKSTRRIKKNN